MPMRSLAQPRDSVYAMGPLLRAVFLSRPNRFIVECKGAAVGRIRAFLPNPGRLWELFLPGAQLYLLDEGASAARKTRYTVAAVDRDGIPVFLHTHDNNLVARRLLERGLVSGLGNAQVKQAEVRAGRSRFDFLLESPRGDTLLEVKSCTLFGNGVAMFPDAVTARGRRHVEELAALAGEARETAVLFLAHTREVQWFMPDYHTDPAFAQAMLAARDRVRFIALSLEWRWRPPMLELTPEVRPLPIPWEHIEREAAGRGSYVIILRLERDAEIDAGGLGAHRFRAGYYLYAGSAARGLDARIARHLRRRKRKRWHIDYLREAASKVEALPIRSAARDEHALAEALEGIYEAGPAGFGAADSPRASHLFYSGTHPLRSAAFHEVLQRFRMKAPPRA